MYYPIHLDLSQFKVTLIGGGKIAFRKCQFFIELGKPVTVVAKTFIPEFMACGNKVTLIQAAYEPRHIADSQLIIAATDDRRLNEEIGDYCRSQKKLVNVASDKQQSNFIIPSQIKSGDLLFSVSTSGKHPRLTKKIKGELKKLYPPIYIEDHE
ncbi:MAG: bifunctional precorrin-2 dehydrogenase/sirohydrochlorin ferrochelatase [Defluviitaleaceae bacterium]|nr:bifunctional precorrin-2 dehydrogenase/sirohydrochlorin ferrochelatase [Defluviitaleaceae bacterium]